MWGGGVARSPIGPRACYDEGKRLVETIMYAYAKQVCMCMCAHVCAYVYVCMCMCVHVWVCVCVCLYNLPKCGGQSCPDFQHFWSQDACLMVGDYEVGRCGKVDGRWLC